MFKINNLNEKGAVIPFFAIALVMILALIGLSIDTSLTSTAHRAHQDTVDMVALSVIEEFSKLPANIPLTTRINDASKRGSSIASENFNFWIGENFIDQKISDQGDLDSGGSSGVNGRIIPGYWYFSKPEVSPGGACRAKEPWMDTDSECPCDFPTGPSGVDVDGWKGGCFVEVTDPGAPLATVNSFRVNLETADGNDLLHTISQVKSKSKGFKIFSSATTAFVPRHVLLAVDLSPSIASENHGVKKASSSPYHESPEKFGKYAYQGSTVSKPGGVDFQILASATVPDPSDDFTYEQDITLTPMVVPFFQSGLYGTSDLKSWACLLGNGVNDGYHSALPANSVTYNLTDPSGGSSPITSPFCLSPQYLGPLDPLMITKRDDYEIFDITSGDGVQIEASPTTVHGTNSGAFIQPRFLLHTSPDPDLQPEPLTSVMTAVHSAMKTFADSGFPSDRVGVVGFDDDILAPRVTKDANGHASLLPPTNDSSIGSDYWSMMNALDPGNANNQPSSRRKDFWDRLFFPRDYSGESYRLNSIAGIEKSNKPVSQSALAGVMSRSLDLFKNAPESDNAQRLFIMFSDGLSTCVDPADPGDLSNGAYHSKYSGIPATDYLFEDNLSPKVRSSCSSINYEHNMKGIEDVVQVARDAFAKDRIKFNLFMFGNASRPHTLLRKGISGGCMKDEEAKSTFTLRYGKEDYDNATMVDSGFKEARFPLETDSWFQFRQMRNAYRDQSPTKPWHLSNHLYFATRYTDGTYFPVRPPCTDGLGTPTDRSSDIEDLCDAITEGNISSNNNKYKGAPALGPLFDIYGNQLAPSSVDSSGRLMCDATGRDTATQVQEELTKLLDTNPFVLVSERTGEGLN